MPFLRTSFLAASPALALILVGASGCDAGSIKGQDAVMSLAKTAPTQQSISVTTQAAAQESCNTRARFVPGVGCEHRRPAMAEPALDEPSCEVGSLDRCVNDCEGGGAWSCGILGKMYRDGIGVRRDVHAAQKWQRRACSLGGVEGCEGPSKSLGSAEASNSPQPSLASSRPRPGRPPLGPVDKRAPARCGRPTPCWRANHTAQKPHALRFRPNVRSSCWAMKYT